MDSAVGIPGTKYRFGADSVMGLVPGLGDIAGGLFSAYIIAESARLGVPRSVVASMVANTLLDVGVGTIPIAGDVFDFFFKSNRKNVELLEQHLPADLVESAEQGVGHGSREADAQA